MVDIDGFQKEVGLDDDTLKELYLVFIEEIQQMKESANRYLSLEKLNELREPIHNIKGIASSYRAQNVFDHAKSLDIKLKGQDFENINRDVSDMTESIDQAIGEITRYFEGDSCL